MEAKMEKQCTNQRTTLYTEKRKKLRDKIYVKLVSNKKYYLKCTSKLSYMSHKIFDNNLVVIRKSKVALKLKKLAYI